MPLPETQLTFHVLSLFALYSTAKVQIKSAAILSVLVFPAREN